MTHLGEKPSTSSKGPTVVLVDDDAGFRGTARQLLVRRGLRVLAEAFDCASAVAAVQTSQPQGVLLDVNLPDGDGYTLSRELRTRRPDLIVVLTSTEALDPAADATEVFVGKDQLAVVDLYRLLTGNPSAEASTNPD